MTWARHAAWLAVFLMLSSAKLEAQDETASTPAEAPSVAEETLSESDVDAEVAAELPALDVSSNDAVADGDTLDVHVEAEDVNISERPVAAAEAPAEAPAQEPPQSTSAPAAVESSLPVEVEVEEVEERDAHTLDRSREQWRPWFSGLVHLSLLSDRLAVSTLNIRFGYGINAGARRGAWGVYGHIEQNLYAETEFDFVARAGTLNLAVGGERFLFRERLRMAAAIGVSVLLTDLALHSTGHTGLFLQVKPMGIRFARQSQVVIQLDLLSITVAAPVLGSPSVVDLQYRTTLGIEWQGR
ncbi:MAG: hypothetical protein ACI9KE_002920 [Polyangiales bacterium]|jgi:hypothetical protein